ncbi:hypothetical protein MHZ95_17870 [Sporosarcina sp. ACRSM]|uniref:hypothetical protein n=1 Tax=Sporosarcina sp. ACRSM TaxID=2918216 RepID=UPI001EF4E440|nr:hypothetical protein [Sporosarcina sp. ACRSM]MCG7337130.1 hypothetical protein [Sporosarcina sp. ACRSM]
MKTNDRKTEQSLLQKGYSTTARIVKKLQLQGIQAEVCKRVTIGLLAPLENPRESLDIL